MKIKGWVGFSDGAPYESAPERTARLRPPRSLLGRGASDGVGGGSRCLTNH
jgi:hypothetical protein